ncbi:Cytosolic carboxypeptidase 1 [Boothiomyces sp. JEL0866]|nr:Cytosolic carboxypeptidase 1 [Boothiomyces sp. JEL0866]
MIKKGSLAKKAEKQKKPILDQQSNLPIVKTPKLKAINLPKLKSRDTNQAITASNVPGPVLRILLAISQTLDEDSSKEDLTPLKDSSAFQSSERISHVSSRDETSVLTSEVSRISLTSSILDNMEEEGEFSFEKSLISSEAKRKIVRSCLDLKRLIDKDSSPILSESVVQKSLFSKSNTNITVLFRCLKEISDIDTSIVITNLLLRLITSCESASSNMIMMTKKNLCQILLVTIYNIHHDYLNNSSIPNLSLNILQRIDEIFNNSFTILCKLSKYGNRQLILEPKLALLARLHGAVPITIKTLKRSVEKKDFGLMAITFNIIRLFASKNDNNLSVIQKSNLVPLLDGIFKNLGQQVNISKFDNAIELMAYLGKSKSIALEIVKTFGMKFFLTHSCSVFEGLQKASLKAIKVLNEYDFGKKAFDIADGSKILSDLLTSECVNMSLTLVNSVSSLLVGALRSAAGQAELPFMDFYTNRTFPLPAEPIVSKTTSNDKMTAPIHFESAPNLYAAHAIPPYLGQRPKTSPNLNQMSEFKDIETDYEDIVDEFAMDLVRGKTKAQGIPPQSIQDLVQSKLRKLCPELSYLENSPVAKCDLPNSNISVRHVQPMAPGKHFVCRNLVSGESEQLLRRSPMTFRKVMFDQTARMFQQSPKGAIVYDVMDYSKSPKTNDGTLIFDSRFESGNLQLAIKVSQFEYDLLIESDINSVPGKHNQWFYFSVKRMVTNTPYKFNILNLSKPASQFNNGMQPVMYSVEDPGWKRVGEYISFDTRNHYRKPGVDPGTLDSAAADANTFSTLVMSISFKHQNDTYDIPIKDRKYVLLSARVHPGESNSSHMMNGLIQFLLSSDEVALSCDFHGHSRKKNAFVFGCENPIGSDIEGLEKIFPQILAQQASIFDFNACRFNIEKSKESTARVVLRREFKIINSFTLESTYCGMDFGEKRGMQVQIPDLEKMGVDFAKAVNTLLGHAEVNSMCSKNIVDVTKSAKSTPCSSDQSPIATPKRTRKVKKSTVKQIAKKNIESKKKEKKVPVRDEPEENSDNSDDDSDDG